jgi:hypothetical protein
MTNILKAILAMDSYNRGYGAYITLPLKENGNFLSVGEAEIATDSTEKLGLGVDASASFYAIAYNYNGQKIISCRGTDDFGSILDLWTDGDIWNGWGVGTGSVEGRQAEMAFEFYQLVVGGIGNVYSADVTLTGHSLGGGLAGLVAALIRRAPPFLIICPIKQLSITRKT